MKTEVKTERKSVMLDIPTHNLARKLAYETNMKMSQIVTLLLNNTTEKDILKLAKKQGKE